MKVYFFSFLFLLLCNSLFAQVVGSPYTIPVYDRLILNQISATPSFAFSTRKLREEYSGPALRLFRDTDNSEVDVAFDSNGVVSGNSIVTLAVVGSSGNSIGTTATLTAYQGANILKVSIWYDQGSNGYNGIQTTAARRPVFSLGVAGASNQYSSLAFTGASKHNVTVNQILPVLLGSGLRGSVMMVAKVLNGVTNNNSFGHSDVTDNNIRWSAHMNWPSDNNMYTDFGSSSDGTRSFLNDASVGVFKQYTMVRNTTSKIVRVSGLGKNNADLSVQSITWSAGSNFGVGITTGSLDANPFNQNGFTGNIPEFILFPEPLTLQQYWIFENNQITFWGCN